MTSSISRAATNKVGTCPHGLPLGACPICNGMGGGGGSVKKNSKPPEMSWSECYAIGQMMKAQKANQKHTQQMFAAQDLASKLNNMLTQIQAMKVAAMNNLPRPLALVVSALADGVLIPVVKVVRAVVNTVQNLTSALSKAMDNIKQKLVDIADKLAAIFGEAKAAIQKKIDEKFKDVKKKIFNLFGIAEVENEEQEELKRIEEEKRLFELNTAKEALFNIFETPEEIDPEEDDTQESEKS